MKIEGVGINLKRIARVRARGLRRPLRAFIEAKKADIPYALLCAVLEKESGGRNVFGHDPMKCAFPDAGSHVTKAKYIRYKKKRSDCGMQGVGPMQLTYYTYQDQADALGGCWKPKFNIRRGAQLIAQYYHENKGDIIVVGTRYNGASVYGKDLQEKFLQWTNYLREGK